MQVQIVGGVMDGALANTSNRPPRWGWIDDRGRVWHAPRPGRRLHHLMPSLEGGPCYLYSERHAYCSNCGVIHAIPDGETRATQACTLCGGVLVAG